MANKLFSDLSKGTYVGATTYTVGDFVDYNGSSYACILNSTGNLPTNATYWALLASAGATGATGSTGATGAQGIQGIQGVQGDPGVGSGTVTTVSVATANGFSGTVANATTTPAITIIAGAITPTSVNGNTITTGTGVLTLGASKTLTVSNTLTIAGTDGKGINVGAATSRKILVGDGTNMILSTETYAVPGTSGNILTSDGTNWTSATPSAGASVPKMINATIFETATRFTISNTGVGSSNTFNTTGLSLTNNDTVSVGYNSFSYVITDNVNGEIGSPSFSAAISWTETAGTPSTNSQMFIGFGVLTVGAGGITFTGKHFGFKIVRSGGGAINLSATQADGTTETASATLTTFADTDTLDLILQVNGSTSVDYYWRKNAGALSSATNLTTNMPTSVSCIGNGIYWRQVSDGNGATLKFKSMSYQR